MKTIFILTMFVAALSAQQKAETESWLIDPSYVKNSVYAFNAGRNPYDALLRSLAGLAETLRMAGQDIQPDKPVSAASVPSYSFGRVNITYQRRSARAAVEKGDSLDFQSTVTFSAKLQFSDGTKRCFISCGSEAVDRANDETFNRSSYSSKAHSEYSSAYEFTGMTFSDLLAELEREGLKIRFRTEYDITYALASYPRMKVKQ